MRRLLFLAAVAVLAIGNSGCLININASNPNRRMGELLNESEDIRSMQDTWERIWFTDQPSHMVPDRVHGGITPGQTLLTPGQ